MKNDSLRVVDYLEHIIDAIRQIAEYTEDIDEAGFLANRLVQDAVIRNIEIIGEAARNVERTALEFVAEHDEVPWAALYAMRNRVAHGYFTVDLEIVWKTVQLDLPELRHMIEPLLKGHAAGRSLGL